MRIDFHLHTYYSDGTMSPKEMIIKAKEQGLDAISITDHNKLDSWKELQALGHTYGIQVIRGVEINCKHKGREYHLLAYGFKDSEELLDLISKASLELERMNAALIEKLLPEYPQISMEDYKVYSYDRTKGGWKGLHYLLDRGLTKELFEGFKFYRAYGCDFSDYNFPELTSLCKAIKGAGGVSVLAHPGEYYKTENIEEILHALEDFKAAGIQGVECYYPTHSKALRDACIGFCKDNNLLITLGSDEHGEFGKQAKKMPQTIGCISDQLAIVDLMPFLGKVEKNEVL